MTNGIRVTQSLTRFVGEKKDNFGHKVVKCFFYTIINILMTTRFNELSFISNYSLS